jgi:hypothetical protein
MLARRSRVLVLFALVGFLSGCGNMTHAKEYAETAIGKFHSELNSAAFGAIYDDTDDNFRKATTREQFQKVLEAVHRKLGQVTGTTTGDWSVRNYNLSTTVVLVQKTQFEHGSGTETFTYAVQGQGVKLMGYNIQSIDLITL